MENLYFNQALVWHPDPPKAFFLLDDYYNTNYFPKNSFVSENASTDSQSVEAENRRHIERLRNNEFYFLQLLSHSDFEDGNSNEAISYIEEQLSINSIATSTWMAEFFDKQQRRGDDGIEMLYGLLRIIAYLNNTDCFNYIQGVLKLILQVALQNSAVYLQEAALMVIESWRSKDYLQLLKEMTFKNPYIQKYADIIKNELTSELEETATCLSE